MTSTEPLLGCTLVVTADRRAGDLISSFERRGARVLHAPTLRIVPVERDATLIAATRRVIEDPPDDVVVTTGVGFRGWIEAADTAGLAADLLGTLASARLLARGPKARGAIRAAGLVEAWSARSEMTSEVVDWLLHQGVTGRRIVVQLHGQPDPGQQEVLRSAGASVRDLEVYRWGPAPDEATVDRALRLICAGGVDAVVHTSAPGAQALLDAAARSGHLDGLIGSLRAGRVVNACVGPVTGSVFESIGLPPLVPDRYRLGALIRIVTERLATGQVPSIDTESLTLGQVPSIDTERLTLGQVLSIDTEFGTLVVRAAAAILDGRVSPLGPGPRAVLAALVAARGRVVSRPDLLSALPAAEDPHAIEVTVNRLRTALGRPELVQTVVRRGYRLAVPVVPASPQAGVVTP